MSDQPAAPRRKGSETGMMPRVDIDPPASQEPAQPPLLPEFDGESAGITGRIPLFSEGEDTAKEADDSATRDDQQPRASRAKKA